MFGAELNLTSQLISKYSEGMESMPYTNTFLQDAKNGRKLDAAMKSAIYTQGAKDFFNSNDRSLGALGNTLLKIWTLPVIFIEQVSSLVKVSSKFPLRMIPGSVVLGAACIGAALADLVRDTALAALNLLGIVITMGSESRSQLFKLHFVRHYINMHDDLAIAVKLPMTVIVDIGANLLYGTVLQMRKAADVISKTYFAVLDKTPIARFYPDQTA